jgi:Uma2 family endonuclease
MATVTQKLLTVDEFMRLPNPPDGSRQELVRGEIVTMAARGFRHGICQLNAASLLHAYARASGTGRVTPESGVITERDPDTVRGPDVAFWSFERLPASSVPEAYPEVAPDMVVEVISATKRLAKVIEKLPEYFEIGVRIVWIVDSEDSTVRVYRSLEEGRILHTNATLSGEDVLPGFSCKVAELFA